MVNNQLEKITNDVYKRLGFIFISIDIAYPLLIFGNLMRSINKWNMLLIITMPLICAISCFLTLRFKKLRIFAAYFIAISISTLAAFPNMKSSLLFFIPIFLSIYTLRIKTIAILSTIVFILKVLSNVFMELFWPASTAVSSAPSNEAVIVSVVFLTLVEFALILLVFIPIFEYLIDLRKHQEKTILEKQKATAELLDFCSTATGYHNKYLSVHIKGVKEITQLILDELRKNNTKISDTYYEQIIFFCSIP